MPKVSSNNVRVGNAIDHKGKLWRVIKINHTMPGKGGAFNQMELRGLKDGSKLNERFRAAEDVEVIRLEQNEYQFLFEDGSNMTIMHPETFEQMEMSLDVLGDQKIYLQDGMNIIVESYEDDIIGAVLPEHVVLEIVETEAVVKGQTAAASNKPAILDNGVRIMVPPFLSEGDRVVVRTVDSQYIEREKK